MIFEYMFITVFLFCLFWNRIKWLDLIDLLTFNLYFSLFFMILNIFTFRFYFEWTAIYFIISFFVFHYYTVFNNGQYIEE